MEFNPIIETRLWEMHTRHGSLHCITPAAQGARNPRSSVPQTRTRSFPGGKCSLTTHDTNIKRGFDESAAEPMQPTTWECLLQAGFAPRNTADNISHKNISMPLARGERTTRAQKPTRLGKSAMGEPFSNKRGPFASTLEKQLLHAAGSTQRLFTSTKTCS